MMFISVIAIPNSKKLEIIEVDERKYKIRLNVPAIDGKANIRLIGALSEHLKVPKSSITIVRGHKSREKIVRVL